MKRRLVVVLAAASLSFGAAGVAPGQLTLADVAWAKPCSAGWVHASLSWGHKCLRRGQFCKSTADREYHRYGFHCHTGRLD